VKYANGYTPANPNATYSNGLFVVQRSQSSVTVTA
jgi:hypothetical protein